MPSLTSHLLSLTPQDLATATTHPFLQASATASLPLPTLQKWLLQDRLYQFAHLNFLAAMLSRVYLTASTTTTAPRDASLEWRAVDLLIDALQNIRQEIRLFEDTARAEGWADVLLDAGVVEDRATRAYGDLFAGATARGRPLVVGLVVLWATEECYLRAWRWAWGQMSEGDRDRAKKQAGKADGGEEVVVVGDERDVMQRVFIPNWSSPAFEAWVRRIGGLVNRFGGFYEVGSWEWGECEAVWRQVVWAEKEFWPDVGKEKEGGE